MAFDQGTRNRLQKFVSASRELLSEELTRQLQAIYGLDPKTGTIARLDELTHLDNRQRQTAQLLREILQHYIAATPGKNDKDKTLQALDRLVREQAFTVLNRMAALRMAEARGFLLESIAKAHSSKGFQLYRQLSGTAHGETGDAYRNYLFSLFDEFSLDLAVLFDRHSAQGRLFPRETALLELLEQINHPEIEYLWGEDETIGWIYQYFNSQEERKKMRAESQAPRNSRELAVRNQFFTPRYVVEFLTDNTLGRIWYEMTKGNTNLVDSCRYLVRRHTEVFLKADVSAAEAEQTDIEAISQEELLKQPVYIPHRPLKDPRTIRMLDPACGSMHFGLYAFDLFEQIYLEAWQLEQELGPDAFARETGQQPLKTTFESLEAFQQQIPKLIIERNIHGVDIDPRAVQIAGLSLWQRAQRAWYQQGIKPQQRPIIVKSNIVCAEPMPGEKALLHEFTSKLTPPILGQLLEVIVEKMQLAGEAGTLLKIEEEIQTAIHEAREQWLKQSGSHSMGDMFQAELDTATPQEKLGFDLRGIDDETFWDDAEQRILQALSDYADQAESSANQKRLFAEDAAKGFAFIDLCRKRFDVVLMNPPFGEYSEKFKDVAVKQYSGGAHDIIAGFVERIISLKYPQGLAGCISSRAVFYGPTNAHWREKVIIENGVPLWVELGEGVLDGAMVETIMYTIGQSSNSVFHRKPDVENFFSGEQLNTLPRYVVDIRDFTSIKNAPFSYWISRKFLNAYKALSSFDGNGGKVKVGLQTGDDFRFIRLWYETNKDYSEDVWFKHAKGGDNSPYFTDVHLLVNWKDRGKEVSAQSSVRLNMYSGNEESLYLKEGLTFSYRTYRFSPAFLPSNTITGVAGMGLYPGRGDLYFFMGFFNSSIANEFINYRLGNVDSRSLYQAGVIAPTPMCEFGDESVQLISELSKENYRAIRELFLTCEFSPEFDPKILLSSSCEERNKNIVKSRVAVIDNFMVIDKVVMEEYEVCEFDFESYDQHISRFKSSLDNLIEGVLVRREDYLSTLLGVFFGLYELDDTIDFERSFNKSIADVDSLVNSVSSMNIKGNFFFADKVYLEQELTRSGGFFSFHLQKATRSRRQSPIYWQLQIPSGLYTLWVYYHRANDQTLYTCVNDFVEPKLEEVNCAISVLRDKNARSSWEEKKLEQLTDLSSELRDFRDELLRLARIWKPNLNDGVQITAAPLWKLFQHKAWQRKLKDTWDKLEKGDYDWAHLALNYWSERVLRKCHEDRSLAIAHDVEDNFWDAVEVPVSRRGKETGETKLEWQQCDLSEPELRALIQRIRQERGL